MQARRYDRLRVVDHPASVAEQAARRSSGGRPDGFERRLLAASHGIALGGYSRALWTIDDLLQSVRATARDWAVGSAV